MGRLQPLRLNVDHHNPRRAGDARAADGIEPDAAGAEDHDRVPGAHVRGVQDGARAGDDAAAEQRRLGEGHLLRHKRELIFMDERAFGKAAQPETLEQANTAAAQSRGIAGPPQRRLRMMALEGAAGQASGAPSARLRERPDDVISNTELRDVGTDLSHDSRNLVAEHRRRRRDVVRGEQQVGMTQA